MISLHSIPDLTTIATLKAEYLDRLLAPMDDMWETGFTNTAPHWEIRIDDDCAGYFAANDNATILQFYVLDTFAYAERQIFDFVLAEGSWTAAEVSTIDPRFLALCLDVQKGLTVHTYLYEAGNVSTPDHPESDTVHFRSLESDELERTIAFQITGLGGDENLREWLEGYSANLIRRGELFVLSSGDDWIGLGECRRSDSQKGVSHLGMIVGPKHRKKGWATYIFQLLAAMAFAEGRRPVCSTTTDNLGAQKAIERTGFENRHRIVRVSL